MAEKRKTRVRLVLLCGALAMAAALILSGALVLAAALVPIRVPHTSTPESTPRPVGTLPAKPGATDAGAEHLAIREWPVVAAEVMARGVLSTMTTSARCSSPDRGPARPVRRARAGADQRRPGTLWLPVGVAV